MGHHTFLDAPPWIISTLVAGQSRFDRDPLRRVCASLDDGLARLLQVTIEKHEGFLSDEKQMI